MLTTTLQRGVSHSLMSWRTLFYYSSEAVLASSDDHSQSSKALYKEMPYTPKQFNAMVKQKLEQLQAQPVESQLKQLLHPLYLYAHGIIPFSYDNYMEICSGLVWQQKKATLEEIFLPMSLAVEYKVTNKLFWSHFENELHIRLRKNLSKELDHYYDCVDQQLASVMSQLEQQSQDYFNLIKQSQNAPQNGLTDEETLQQQHPDGIETCINTMVSAPKPLVRAGTDEASRTEPVASNRSKKQSGEFTLADLLKISEYLVWYNSRDCRLLEFLLEIITVRLISRQAQPSEVVAHLKLTTHLCQSYMQEYQANPKKYTARSMKGIYKLQTHYYVEHFHQVQGTLADFDLPELHQLIDVYVSFPIKARAIRKKIGKLVAEEVLERQLEAQPILEKMLPLNKNDPKMTKLYYYIMGLPHLYIEPLQPVLEQTPNQSSLDQPQPSAPAN